MVCEPVSWCQPGEVSLTAYLMQATAQYATEQHMDRLKIVTYFALYRAIMLWTSCAAANRLISAAGTYC